MLSCFCGEFCLFLYLTLVVWLAFVYCLVCFLCGLARYCGLTLLLGFCCLLLLDVIIIWYLVAVFPVEGTGLRLSFFGFVSFVVFGLGVGCRWLFHFGCFLWVVGLLENRLFGVLILFGLW